MGEEAEVLDLVSGFWRNWAADSCCWRLTLNVVVKRCSNGLWGFPLSRQGNQPEREIEPLPLQGS